MKKLVCASAMLAMLVVGAFAYAGVSGGGHTSGVSGGG